MYGKAGDEGQNLIPMVSFFARGNSEAPPGATERNDATRFIRHSSVTSEVFSRLFQLSGCIEVLMTISSTNEPFQ